MSEKKPRKKRKRPWPLTVKERVLLREFLDYWDLADWFGKRLGGEFPCEAMLMQFAPPLTHASIRLATMAASRAADAAFREVALIPENTDA